MWSDNARSEMHSSSNDVHQAEKQQLLKVNRPNTIINNNNVNNVNQPKKDNAKKKIEKGATVSYNTSEGWKDGGKIIRTEDRIDPIYFTIKSKDGDILSQWPISALKLVDSSILLLLGVPGHEKDATFDNLFSKKNKSQRTASRQINGRKLKTKVEKYGEDESLIIINTPDINQTIQQNLHTTIFKEIEKCASDTGDPTTVIACRKLLYPENGGFRALQSVIRYIEDKWEKTTRILVYTQSSDTPHTGTSSKEFIVKERQKYEKKGLTQKQANCRALYNLRIAQAKKLGFGAVFFIDNTILTDQESLPDETNCWIPIVRFLGETSVLRNSFSQIAQTAYCNIPGSSGSLRCYACAFPNDEKNDDCELCKAPLSTEYWKNTTFD